MRFVQVSLTDSAHRARPALARRHSEARTPCRGDAEIDRTRHRAWGVKSSCADEDVRYRRPCSAPWRKEAEALREKRARLIKAEAERDAAEQLRNAAEVIMHNPAGLEAPAHADDHRVGAEQNTMTISDAERVRPWRGHRGDGPKVWETGNHFLLVNRIGGMPTFEQTNLQHSPP